MIAVSAVIAASALVGWLAGLTAHALIATGWKDPGARAAWSGAAALIATPALAVAIIVCVLCLPGVCLLLVPAFALAGAAGAFKTCGAIALPGPKPEERPGEADTHRAQA